MSSTDVLQALRHATLKQQPITYLQNGGPTKDLAQATHIKIGSTLVVPKDTPTRWRKPLVKDGTSAPPATDPQMEPDRFFSLTAVLVCWITRQESGAAYMRHATTTVPNGFFSLAERQDAIKWLSGNIETHSNIVPLQVSTTPTTPPSTLTALPAATVSPSKPLAGDSSALGHGQQRKRAHVPDAADLEAVKRIRANEIELRDRTTVLRGVKVNNFTQVKDYVTQIKSAVKGGTKTPASSGAATPMSSAGSVAGSSVTSTPKAGSKKTRIFPIIMVSSSPTALLTLHNIKKFLEESIFESSEIARQRNGGKTEDMIPIYRKRTQIGPGGRETETRIKYFAVDSVDALGKFGAEAWDRVVCVMTTGQEWQFKPYKWTEPRQLFHNVKGVHFSWANEPPNPRIRDWNVSEMKIDQLKRHVDKSVVADFWRLLDAWMTAHKPSLLL